MRIDGVNEKFGYLVQSTLKLATRSGRACPNCGSARSDVVARKYVVTELRRCEQCRLMFRAPVTPPEASASYYQDDYESGMTTSMPTDAELTRLMETSFRGTEKDFLRYVAILAALGVAPGSRLLDYGCSWGYGTWQFERAGYRVSGFEVSQPRARFASDKLKLDAGSTLRPEWHGSFDAVFSAHVLEHVPSIADAFAATARCLKPGGLFVAITPNGAFDRRVHDPARWQNAWGLKHPNLLDEEFWQRQLAGRAALITTDIDDLDTLTRWASGQSSHIGSLQDGELLAACRM